VPQAHEQGHAARVIDQVAEDAVAGRVALDAVEEEGGAVAQRQQLGDRADLQVPVGAIHLAQLALGL
jgi:hypothetical protein